MRIDDDVLIKEFINTLDKQQRNMFLKVIKIIKEDENANLKILLELLKGKLNVIDN